MMLQYVTCRKKMFIVTYDQSETEKRRKCYLRSLCKTKRFNFLQGQRERGRFLHDVAKQGIRRKLLHETTS